MVLGYLFQSLYLVSVSSTAQENGRIKVEETKVFDMHNFSVMSSQYESLNAKYLMLIEQVSMYCYDDITH